MTDNYARWSDVEIKGHCAQMLDVPYSDVVSINREERTVTLIDGCTYPIPDDWDLE